MKVTSKKLFLVLLVMSGVGGLVLGSDFLCYPERLPVDDEHLILLTLKAGMAAAMAEDLDESLRFISADYRDDLGFNSNLMRGLLERAYEEFDQPRIELAGPPQIQIEGRQAVVLAQITLTAIYHDRRNYLLGNRDHPNTILLLLEKSANNWKISKIEGLQPLGFEEPFLNSWELSLGSF